jgi:hypothetical protein
MLAVAAGLTVTAAVVPLRREQAAPIARSGPPASSPRPGSGSAEAGIVRVTLVAGSVRSAQGSAPTIVLAPDTRELILDLDLPEPAPPECCQVTVRRTSGRIVWAGAARFREQRQASSVTLPAVDVGEGAHQVLLVGADGAAFEAYGFVVVRRPR